MAKKKVEAPAPAARPLVRMRVLQSFGSLVDGVAICPHRGQVIERGEEEARRLEESGTAERILDADQQLVSAARKLGVALVTDRPAIISAAAAAGVGVVKPGK